MSQNSIVDEDRALLYLAVEELQRYLLSNELYWPLFTDRKMKLVNPRSRLTPGNLLLSIQRLSFIQFDEDRRELINSKVQQYESIRNEWRSHWMQKAQLEYSARMDLWHAYLQDLFEDQTSYAINYAYAVRWRVILKLLEKTELGLNEVSVITLATLDENLKAISIPAPFIWGEEFMQAFPESDFWFLYRSVCK
ncbi:MAG: hypothetical protein JEZ00_03525 [Anaerolineaceae bacterium]|nr:hypothetical protein [Anaerolineaceae bacterium]